MNKNHDKFYLEAASIDEILSSDFEALVGQKSDAEKAALRLSSWCKSSASGNWRLFETRLKRDNLTIIDVLGRFANAKVKEGIKYPQWVEDAEWIMDALCQKYDSNIINRDDFVTTQVPFEDIFLSLVFHADEIVWKNLEENNKEIFSIQSKKDLRAILILQLSELCAPVLYQLFEVFKSQNSKQTVNDNNQDLKIFGRDYYNKFILEMQSLGIKNLFNEKPVLLRLISSVVRQWIEVSTELITRCSNDEKILKKTFLNNVDTLKVESIKGGISDHHDSGHSVMVLEFSDLSKVVYKPKDCNLDANWTSLINKLNDSSLSPFKLKAAEVIAQKGYGWMEFVSDSPCTQEEEIELFYRRAGALLAIFHVFVGADMHYENIIASGSFPVPIDIEMLLQASNLDAEAEDDSDAVNMAISKTIDSVLTVGMLPNFIKNGNNELVGIGGLNFRQHDVRYKEWTNLNTDQMIQRFVTRATKKSTNLPYLNGEPGLLTENLSYFLEGFKDYLNCLINLRDKIGLDEFFSGFSGLKTRKVIKPTRFYYGLIQRLTDIKNMNDGVIWSCELDFVSRFSDWEKEKDPLWSINLHERLALAELNIPTFFHLVDECKIINSRSLDLTSLSIPGLQRAVNRLSNLNKDEVNWQIEIIKASTVGMIAYNENLEEGDYFQINDSIEGSDLFLINEARAIVKTLEATAFRSNGRASWIGLDWIDGSNNSQISPMSNDLYNGVVGISLFLIAYGKETGSRDAINLGLDGISRLRDSLRGANAERIARGMGIGGVSGLGSIVYTFTVISDLLDDEGILDDARNAAKLFTNDLINTDKKLDFLAGSAGAILGLLKLYRSSKEQWILDRAIECGNYLLSQPRNELSGKISWNCSGVSSLPLNGISHGAAGFAYALSSLARATGINKYEVAAAECIDYENSSFNSQTFNWPDFRKGVPAKDVEKICQWCHGGVGIGLARLGIKKNGIGDHEILMHDVSEALNGVYETGRKPQDSLCCGELGRIEFIYEAGKNANNQAIIDDAKKLLCNVIKTAHSQGEYRFGGGAQNFHLSFFRGLSGVGYSILRQLNPNLPNVLILE